MDQQLDERCHRCSPRRVAQSLICVACRLLPLRLSPVFIDLVLGRLRLENDSRHPLGANVDALPFERLSASQIKGGELCCAQDLCHALTYRAFILPSHRSASEVAASIVASSPQWRAWLG